MSLCNFKYKERLVNISGVDKPVSFIKIFDKTKQQRIVELVAGIKENAVRVV